MTKPKTNKMKTPTTNVTTRVTVVRRETGRGNVTLNEMIKRVIFSSQRDGVIRPDLKLNKTGYLVLFFDITNEGSIEEVSVMSKTKTRDPWYTTELHFLGLLLVFLSPGLWETKNTGFRFYIH